MSPDACAHGAPLSRACPDCDRAQWSTVQVEEALESLGRGMDSPCLRFAPLDPDDLRIIADTARQALELRKRVEAGRAAGDPERRGRDLGIEEAISVCELNMPYESMALSATIRVLFRRFVGELRKLRAAGSVEAYLALPSAGRYE